MQGKGLALLLALLPALAVGCGGGGEPTSRAAPQRESGAARFYVKGGDNSIQESGTEASLAERRQAAVALHGYLDAGIRGDWVTACRFLSRRTAAQLAALLRLSGKPCPVVLGAYLASVPKQHFIDAARAEVGSFRITGRRGFLLYHGAGHVDYEIPIVREAGRWMLGATAGSVGMRRIALVLSLLPLLLTAYASAEISEKGDLFVRFDGGISPHDLPRSSLSPIAVRIEGSIRTPGGPERPALRHIEVGLNRGGRLSARGLPVCSRRQIDSATPSEAIAICGQALVGTGGLTARTSFPNQAAYLLHGEILLFNGISAGRPAILAHVFQRQPVPIVRFMVFHIRHTTGTFGTVISGRVPPTINRNGYLTSIFLQLQRRYVFRGRRRAYISASCAAPRGVPVAAFPFARASMSFDDGRTLSSTLIRSCRVRG